MQCSYILTRGPRAGTECGKRRMATAATCAAHRNCQHRIKLANCVTCTNARKFVAAFTKMSRALGQMCTEIDNARDGAETVAAARRLAISTALISTVTGAAVVAARAAVQ